MNRMAWLLAVLSGVSSWGQGSSTARHNKPIYRSIALESYSVGPKEFLKDVHGNRLEVQGHGIFYHGLRGDDMVPVFSAGVNDYVQLGKKSWPIIIVVGDVYQEFYAINVEVISTDFCVLKRVLLCEPRVKRQFSSQRSVGLLESFTDINDQPLEREGYQLLFWGPRDSHLIRLAHVPMRRNLPWQFVDLRTANLPAPYSFLGQEVVVTKVGNDSLRYRTN